MGLNCRILAFTIDRWMQLDERHRLDVFSGASQTWPLFCLYRGDLSIQGGYFYYKEGVNSPCSAPPQSRKSPLHGCGPGRSSSIKIPLPTRAAFPPVEPKYTTVSDEEVGAIALLVFF